MGSIVAKRLLPLVAALACVHPLTARAANARLDGRVVLVQLCDREDGCTKETRALAAWAASKGLPLVDFDAVGKSGPGGEDARLLFTRAYEELLRKPSLESAQAASQALESLPFTVSGNELFLLHLLLGDQLLAAGRTDPAEQAFSRAASVSEGRVVDLPTISQASLERYFQAVQRQASELPASLQINARSSGANLYIDGRLIGLAPATVPVQGTWHRLSAERGGRRTAWVGKVQSIPGITLNVQAELDMDDGPAALEAAVLGQIRGVPAPADLVASLSEWARGRELDWVRFITLYPVDSTDLAGATTIPDPNPNEGHWSSMATWLDVRKGTFDKEGPSESELRDALPGEHFRMGLGAGYAFLGDRHHVSVELQSLVRVSTATAIDLRLGLLRTGEPYYLYEGWIDTQVFPLSAGLRFGGLDGGPHAGIGALAVIPYAIGGKASAGWDLVPSTWWRVGVEAQGGWTDKGWFTGGGLTVARTY